jgi:hypothetical protein
MGVWAGLMGVDANPKVAVRTFASETEPVNRDIAMGAWPWRRGALNVCFLKRLIGRAVPGSGPDWTLASAPDPLGA